MSNARNEQNLKLAVIGFGFMGAVHAGNVLRTPGVELAAIIDNRDGDIFRDLNSRGNQGKLDLPLEQLQCVPRFPTLRHALEQVALDGCIVAVPLPCHLPVALDVLDRKLHCLLEKPFAPTAAACRQLIAKAAEVDKLLMVAHNVRFDPAWEVLRQWLEGKKYGALRWLTTTRMAGEPGWGMWQDNSVRQNSGGALTDMLIHDLDFVGSILGEPATMHTIIRSNDYWQILLEYPGIPVTVTGGFLSSGMPFEAGFSAQFEHAALCYRSGQGGTLTSATGDGVNVRIPTGDSYQRELDEWIACIRTGQPSRRVPNYEATRTIDWCNRLISGNAQCESIRLQCGGLPPEISAPDDNPEKPF